MQYIKMYLISFLVFIVIDLIWLGIIAKNLYSKYLGYLMTDNINWFSAFIFYMIFIFGILIFVLNPALEKNSLYHSIIFGALFGFVTYATYDLTNLATVKDWPLTITIIDLIWGSTLSSLTSSISFILIKKIM